MQTAVYSTVQHSTLQYSTVQHSTLQYSTVQYSTVQYSTVQEGTLVWNYTNINLILSINKFLENNRETLHLKHLEDCEM